SRQRPSSAISYCASEWNRCRPTRPRSSQRPSAPSSRAGPRRSRIPAQKWIEENFMANPVIDVHTHCLTEAWFDLLKQHGGPRYSVKTVAGGMRAIHLDGAPFMTPVPAMFDYDLRIKTMNDIGVDVCIVSLTCPNCYWGGPEVSLQAARIMNDDMAAART